MGHPVLDLTNKTAVVIGGTSGIGLALTKALAQAGANVIPSGRRAELVRSAASEVEALDRRSLAAVPQRDRAAQARDQEHGGEPRRRHRHVRRRRLPGSSRTGVSVSISSCSQSAVSSGVSRFS